MFDWFEVVRTFLTEQQNSENGDDDSNNDVNKNDAKHGIDDETTTVVVPDVVSGDTITDRKSAFQAHLAPVTSRVEVCCTGVG